MTLTEFQSLKEHLRLKNGISIIIRFTNGTIQATRYGNGPWPGYTSNSNITTKDYINISPNNDVQRILLEDIEAIERA